MLLARYLLNPARSHHSSKSMMRLIHSSRHHSLTQRIRPVSTNKSVLERPVAAAVATTPLAATVARPRPRRRLIRTTLLGAVIPIAILVLWQLLATSNLIPS